MARQPRSAPGGLVYHVLNRTVAGLPLFRKDGDYEAFERIKVEALRKQLLARAKTKGEKEAIQEV